MEFFRRTRGVRVCLPYSRFPRNGRISIKIKPRVDRIMRARPAHYNVRSQYVYKKKKEYI